MVLFDKDQALYGRTQLPEIAIRNAKVLGAMQSSPTSLTLPSALEAPCRQVPVERVRPPRRDGRNVKDYFLSLLFFSPGVTSSAFFSPAGLLWPGATDLPCVAAGGGGVGPLLPAAWASCDAMAAATSAAAQIAIFFRVFMRTPPFGCERSAGPRLRESIKTVSVHLARILGRASDNGRRWGVIFVNRPRRSGSCQRVNLAPKLERYRLMCLLRLSLHVFQLNVFQLNKCKTQLMLAFGEKAPGKMDKEHPHDACGEIREPAGGAGLSAYIASKLPVEVQAAVIPRAHLVLVGPTCREARLHLS